MKLITSIIWLCSGIVWTKVVVQTNNNWYWIPIIISFVASAAYAIAFDRQIKK